MKGAPVVLALDVGSSSVRAALYDAQGASVGRVCRRATTWRVTPDGGMETDAVAVVDAALETIDGAVGEARALGAEVAAVGVATFWHSLVGLGADGEPVTPLFGWGDSRPAGAARRLRERVDAAVAHRRTGCWVHESYPAARLLWLRETRGDSFRRAAAWMGPGELLALRLFGERRVSLSMASGTGLLDGTRLAWDEEMLAAVSISPAHLSPLADVDAPLAGLRPEWARRWPELAAIPWLPALGDGACASLGSGAAGPGRIGITVATSAAVRALRASGPGEAPEGLWRYRLDARRAVTGRAFSNGGSTYAWLRSRWKLPPPDALEAELAAMPAAAHGLTVLPSLLGERPPGTGGPLGALVGLSAATSGAQVVRAWMEAVALRIAEGAEVLAGVAGPVEAVVASGGALNASPAWTRLLADALGWPVTLTGEPEDTCRGAALVALEALGLVDDAFAAGRRTATAAAYTPDPAAHARLRAAGARMRRLERALRDPEVPNQPPETPEP